MSINISSKRIKPTKTSLVLDIDGTLTPARQPIQKEMVDLLSKLNVTFYVAAGSHRQLLVNQFFEPLYSLGFRKQFDAFISNGAIHYYCDYSKEMFIEKVSNFNMFDYLGNSYYEKLKRILLESLKIDQFQLSSNLKIFENRFVDRHAMINVCPIGRKTIEDKEALKNRKLFISFDKATGYRKRLLEYIKRELVPLNRQLEAKKKKTIKAMLGGQTSFDIGIDGEDKTKPIRILLENGCESVIFIGDALYEGGNDSVVNDYIESWPKISLCPIRAEKIDSWKDTIEIFNRYGFIS